MNQPTEQEIKDVKFAHSHSIDRMAVTVCQLKDSLAGLAIDHNNDQALILSMRNERAILQKEVDNLAQQRKEAYAVIDKQEKELENYGNRAEETKTLLAELQSKYIMKIELLQQSETDRANTAVAFAQKLEHFMLKVAEVESINRGLQAKTRQFDKVLAENLDLMNQINSRRWWKWAAAPFTERYARYKEERRNRLEYMVDNT